MPEEKAVKSAERTVRLLGTLADAPAKMTFAELIQATGYPRSSLHALLRTLRDLHWVETDESQTRFGVGPQLLLAGTAYLDKDPALPHALRTLDALRDEVRHTVHYARRDGAYVVYLASRESTIEVRRIFRVGRRLPAHLTALGQALLAQLTTTEARAVLPRTLSRLTTHSITTRAALFTELDGVRARGYAHESQQNTIGIACVARVVEYRIPATDAISCSLPAGIKGRELSRITQALIQHTDALAATLRREGIR